MGYYAKFIEAVERTSSWGFDPGDITLDKSVKYLNEDSHTELIRLFDWNYKGLDNQKLDCTNVSVNMIDLVSDLFCTDAHLTTGNVSSDNGSFFECSIEYLKRLTTVKPKFNPKLKVHMWITLSSGEIVDFTFFKSMAMTFENWKPMESQIVSSLIINELQMQYSPMIVGSDFYLLTGNMHKIRPKT